MTDVEQRFPEVYRICQKFQINNEQLKELVKRVHNEIELGLDKSTQQRASIKCFPTYVHDVPAGDENGHFMSISLEASYLSVHMLTLENWTVQSIETKKYEYKFQKQSCTYTTLFDYVAKCLADFLKNHSAGNRTLPLGCTMCFPCRQQGLTKATVISWNLDFNCEGIVGKDIGKLLQGAIERRNDICLKVVVLLNDTTGTFIACGYRHPTCRVGVIVDAGTNACYLEYIKRVNTTKIDDTSKTRMLINTEWGSFGENGVLDFIRTDYDKAVDRLSKNMGSKSFEKLVAGRYLGEIVRLVLLDLMAAGVLFKDGKSDMLNKRGKFETSLIAMILNDDSQVLAALQNLGLTASADDLIILRYICETISLRSARLVSAGMACLLNRLNECHMVIGIEGYVYKTIPKYHDYLLSTMRSLVKPGIRYELVPTNNGIGEGCALAAALSSYYM